MSEQIMTHETMKRFISSLLLLLCILQSHAQEALWWQTPTTSPEINANQTVTFRLKAPQAKSVSVTGDFLPNETTVKDGQIVEMQGSAIMRKVGTGVWEFTTRQPVKPGLYSYTFIVDGMQIPDPSNVYTVRDVVSMKSTLFVEGGRESEIYKFQDVPHGTVSRIWYRCEASGKERRLSVYTPAGYETSGLRYPVLYLLHGMGGDEESWLTLGNLAQIMDNLIAQGKAKPMIVVMPNGNMDLQAAPGYGPEGYIVPTIELPHTTDGWFEQSFPNIVRFIDKNYHTTPRKQSRAIAGLSMGGFHAMQISKEYPDLFNYVGLFSAAINHGQGDTPIYQNFMNKLRTQFARKPELYWIAIGKEDFLYNENAEFCQMLDTNRFRHEYFETHGGHTWRNWRLYLKLFVQKIF